MTLTIELPEELGAALKTQARAEGVSADRYVRRVLENALTSVPAAENREPFETSRGILAQYGPAPSAEEIDANRAEMFRGFARGF